MNARYYRGGDRRFVYDVEATYRCPWALGPPPDVLATALAGGLTGLSVIFAKAHRQATRIRAQDSNGRKTDRCATCGAKLEKVGYRAWIEAPYPDVVAELRRLGRGEDASAAEGSARISERLGGDEYAPWPGSSRYFGLKREAVAWCREQAQSASL
jgi:hypothetical protein